MVVNSLLKITMLPTADMNFLSARNIPMLAVIIAVSMDCAGANRELFAKPFSL
jgi:hypothetical protein